MGKLARVRADFPLVKGFVWFYFKDVKGYFLIRKSEATTRAFKAFLIEQGGALMDSWS